MLLHELLQLMLWLSLSSLLMGRFPPQLVLMLSVMLLRLLLLRLLLFLVRLRLYRFLVLLLFSLRRLQRSKFMQWVLIQWATDFILDIFLRYRIASSLYA